MISLKEWQVIRFTGEDREAFLQGLTTNNVLTLETNSAHFFLILTPQGKYLFDGFLYKTSDALWLECRASQCAELLKKLTLYRLKSKVEWQEMPHRVYACFKERSKAEAQAITHRGYAYPDPRHPAMGMRLVLTDPIECDEDPSIYHQKRIEFGLAEGEWDMKSGADFPLEFGMDTQRAIDFNKGCYVGQEVTARTHYRGKIKKRIIRIRSEKGLPACGAPIWSRKGIRVGEVLSSKGSEGLASLREGDVDEVMYVDGEKNVNGVEEVNAPKWEISKIPLEL